MTPVAHFSEHLLSFLLRQSFIGLIFFVIALLFSKLLQKRQPVWSYFIWVLFFIRLLLPSDFSQPFSLRALLDPLFESHKITLADPQATSVGLEIEGIMGTAKAGHPSTLNLIFSAQNLVFLWLIGVLYFSRQFIIHRRRWSRIARQADPIAAPDLLSIADEWAQRFSIHRHVRLASAKTTHSSFTIGILRPVIVLPTSLLASATPECIEAIISHEMAHIKRWDDFWKVMQKLVQIFYFFHPAVWLAGFQLNAARECRCDGEVLAQKKLSPRIYGQALITALKSASFSKASLDLSPVFFSTKQVLNQRIHFIKKGKTMQPSLLTKILFIIIAAAVLPMAGSSKPIAPIQSTATISEGSTLQLINPLPVGLYRLTAKFGMMKHPLTGKNVFHRAVDLGAPRGTQVSAATDGIVVKTFLVANAKPDDDTASGNTIEIEHRDGFRTRYTHLDTVSVVEQQKVQQGEKIGEVGSSGISTGPHLHFEVIKDGQPVNPQDYIQF
jgi:murein DD-endopeptidase MepM/ murein hydrolase activator NlpD